MLRYESLLKTITVECKTVINALLLHINSFQIAMLDSLSCSFSSIAFISLVERRGRDYMVFGITTTLLPFKL